MLLTLYSLQRTSAVLSLRVEQVDLLRSRIDFQPQSRPLTRKRRAVVPIAAPLWKELATAIRESRTGHVIEFKGEPIKSVRRSFNQAAKRAGLKGTSPTILRHTGATLLAAAGVPMRQISGMLGHSHSRTTERYAKHQPEYLKEAIEALEEMFV